MYHAIVRRRIAAAFEQLSRGEWEPLLAEMADDVHHVFAGEHPLGGERHTRAAVAKWFARLGRLFPGHDFDVRGVVARGWPWSTWVAVEWTARLRPQEAEGYVNEGAHWIHIRWGKVRYFHGYINTQLVDRACRTMAEHGIDEAGAAAIVD